MNLLDEITSNFQSWHHHKLDDGTTMHSQKFSGNIHRQLKSNFKSAYNLLSQGDRTVIVSCFVSYTSVAILMES